jgi:hypothetical protein
LKSATPAPSPASSGPIIPTPDPIANFATEPDDGGPLDVFLRPVAILDDGGQTLAVSGGNDGIDGLWHNRRIAQTSQRVNLLFGSEH